MEVTPTEFVRRPILPALSGLVAGRCGFSEDLRYITPRHLPAGSLAPVVIAWGAGLDMAEATGASGAGRRYVSLVSGFRTGPTLTNHSGAYEGVQVYLTPLGVRRILALPGIEIADHVLDLVDVAPRLAALADRLAASPSWAERFAVVDQTLLGLARRGREEHPAVGWLWHELIRSGGRAPIRELIERTGFTHRHVGALFRREVGLSPKAAAGVVRFEHAAAALRAGASPARVAAEAGYADQSHLTREFSRFAGDTPSSWTNETRPSAYSALDRDPQDLVGQG